MSLNFWGSRKRINALLERMDKATNDSDRHRIHAHGLIDSKLEDEEIDWKEAQKRKDDWDRRHGY